MGTVIVKIKIMPESIETNLGEIENRIKKELEAENSNNYKTEIKPIAFGLKALIIMFEWPEEKPLEEFEEKIRKIQGISSLEILDMRRALG